MDGELAATSLLSSSIESLVENRGVDDAFQWMFYSFEFDDEKLKRIEEDYRSGKLLSGD